MGSSIEPWLEEVVIEHCSPAGRESPLSAVDDRAEWRKLEKVVERLGNWKGSRKDEGAEYERQAGICNV